MNSLEVVAKLKRKLDVKNSRLSISKLDENILLFESKRCLILPSDLAEYFRMLDDVDPVIDDKLYQFYTIESFKGLGKGLALEGSEDCFVFADYMFHLYEYAIRLYPDRRDVNEVYGICGDKYGLLANSLTEFLNLYFEGSQVLQNV